MRYTVVREHEISEDCIVCGTHNDLGLHTHFYELENGVLVAKVTPQPAHQSYPGRVHGGVLAALLDETIGRSLNCTEWGTFAVTLSLSVQYRTPVPYGEELLVTGRVTKDLGRLFEGEGTLYTPDGKVGATATARYMKLPIDTITAGASDTGVVVVPHGDIPATIDLPD